ncbi:hypothetical protein [Chitinolyticbacter meiyuanensis]|uniref:hypothetical protein n=1 Tax=Chitinolyticbacter meiyuanensis TaxID=682798 RepID=UPI0011E5D262|nr:hypothetical protein [Chitinolyticbacter meiyuanensis]
MSRIRMLQCSLLLNFALLAGLQPAGAAGAGEALREGRRQIELQYRNQLDQCRGAQSCAEEAALDRRIALEDLAAEVSGTAEARINAARNKVAAAYELALGRCDAAAVGETCRETARQRRDLSWQEIAANAEAFRGGTAVSWQDSEVKQAERRCAAMAAEERDRCVMTRLHVGQL